jgi:hypothetical protein
MQKKSIFRFQNSPKIFPNDLNFSKEAGLANTHAVRPEGSLVTYHFNLNNFSKFSKSIYNFIVEAEREILEKKAPHYYKK